MADGPTVLIAAQSGRALAEAARRAGFRPLVADLFADLDTRRAAEAVEQVPGRIGAGFRLKDLIPALERLAAAAASPPVGLVLGPGFEDRARAVEVLDRRFGVIGCGRAAVAAAKNPERLAALCRDLGVPHPPVRRDVPDDGRTWIRKRIGASGGAHVRVARRIGAVRRGYYVQPLIPGRSASLTAFAWRGADGERGLAPVGFALQIADPTEGHPFRFGGLAAPAAPPPTIAAAVIDAARRLAAAIGLVGIVTFDFLIHDRTAVGDASGAPDGSDTWTLLEINPRPGASLDVMDRTGVPLFAMHVASVRDGPVDPGNLPATVRALRTVYADRPIERLPAIDWPEWVRDRSEAGVSIGAGEPIATVVADAPGTPDALNEAMNEAERRIALVRRLAADDLNDKRRDVDDAPDREVMGDLES